jgi:hypothetical protein
MKKRKTTRTAQDGRAKQTENNGPKAKQKTARRAAGRPASTPKRTTQRLKGRTKKGAAT